MPNGVARGAVFDAEPAEWLADIKRSVGPNVYRRPPSATRWQMPAPDA